METNITEQWKMGYSDGEASVLDFLLEMRGLDLEEEYDKWCNADEYINFKGEIVKRYA